VISDEYPKTFREVGIMLHSMREDVTELREIAKEIKSGQQRVVWWIASALSSFMVGGLLGWLFQK
jgi:hypothetical protein